MEQRLLQRLTGRDPVERWTACQELAALPEEELREHCGVLLGCLKDPEFFVRSTACRALEHLEPEAFLDPDVLGLCLSDRTAVAVRRSAAAAAAAAARAAEVAEVAAVAGLLLEALQDEDPLVRWSCCKALEPMPPSQLAAHLKGRIAELCTAPRGRRLAQTGGAKDVLVRSFVLSVLAPRLEDPDYLSPEASTLASCLEDVAWKVRRGACQALGWCHSAAVAPHAAALARCVDDDDARVARSALGALRRCGDWALRPWAQLLAEHFDEEDEKMRTAALVAFAQIKGAEVLSPHATALAASAHGSEPGPVRRASCQALSRCHPQVLQPYLHLLAPYMEDQDLEVRIAVCQAFAKCDPSFIAPYVSPLARRLKDCLLVRWNACRALLECKPALLLPHLDLLTELLQDHNKQVRQLAQRLLARCFPEASPKT